MSNDPEDQTVRLCIPHDVQLTILGAHEDRFKVRFDQSRHYEKRLGPGSARANAYPSHFFCFDYLGDDSLRADMLTPKENYKSLDTAEAEIVIDISRRTSAFNSASKQQRQTDANPFQSIQPTLDRNLEDHFYSSNHQRTKTPNDFFDQQSIRRNSQDGLHGIQNNESHLEQKRVFAGESNRIPAQPQVPVDSKRDSNSEQQSLRKKKTGESKPANHSIPAVEKQHKTAKPLSRPSTHSNESTDKPIFARDSLEAARGPPKEPSVPTPVPIVQARNVVSENNVTSKPTDSKGPKPANPSQHHPKPKSQVDQPTALHRSIDPKSELSATDYKLSQDDNPFDRRKGSQKPTNPPNHLSQQQQKRADSGIPFSSAGSDLSPKSENTRERRLLLLDNLSYLEQEIKKIQGQGRLTSEEEGHLHQMYHKLNDVKERLSLLDPGLDPFRKTLGDRATLESGFRRRNLGQAEAYNPDNLSSDYKKHNHLDQSPADPRTASQLLQTKKPSASFVEATGRLEKEHFIFKKKLTQLTTNNSKPQTNPKRVPVLKDSPRRHFVPPPVSKTTKNTDRTTTQSKTGILKPGKPHPDFNSRLHTESMHPNHHDTHSFEDAPALRRKSLSRLKHHKLPA